MNIALNYILVAMVAGSFAASTLDAVAQSPAPAQNSTTTFGQATPEASSARSSQIAFLQMGSMVALQRQKADAMNLFQATQFGLAADAYRKICVAEPNLGSNHYWLAESLYEQSQFAAASAEFSRAVTLEPQNEKSYVRLAEALCAARNYSQAKDAALQAMPNVHDERLRGRLSAVMRVSLIGAPHSPNVASRSPNHIENRKTK